MSKARKQSTPRKAGKKVNAPRKWRDRQKDHERGAAMALELVDVIVSHALQWNGYTCLSTADRIRFCVTRAGRDVSDGMLWRLVEILAATCTHHTTADFRAADARQRRALREAEEAERKRDAAWKAHEKAQKAGAQ